MKLVPGSSRALLFASILALAPLASAAAQQSEAPAAAPEAPAESPTAAPPAPSDTAPAMPSPAPETAAPVTAAPVTAAPVTAAPVAPPQAETPFYLIGRPDTEGAKKLDVIAAPPVPAPADKLPLAKLKVPQGFKLEIWASGIHDARGLRLGEKGTVFVSSLFEAGKIYAVVDKSGKREVKIIADKLMLPNGIEYHKGALYVATPKEVTRYDNIEAHLDDPPKPVTVYDKLPGDVPHGWKFIKVGPDGKLYVPVGAPCNICNPSDQQYAHIRRIDLDGSGMEVVAYGVRNTVGFDWHPVTKQLYFTDNGRDWLSEDLPNDELNRLTQTGQHFGFPFCHQGDLRDNEFGWGRSCDEFVKPIALLGPHAAALGMRFYTGNMFPNQYRNAIFIARHGAWNRSQKTGGDVVVAHLNRDGSIRSVEPFLTGFIENNNYLGRPVDVLVMQDGSLLVSDDYNGAIYRVSYGAGRVSRRQSSGQGTAASRPPREIGRR